MNKFWTISLFIASYFIGTFDSIAQTKGLELGLQVGTNQPIGRFYDRSNFTGRGLHFAGSIDYYFSRLGIGISGGYFENNSRKLFTSFVSDTYFEKAALDGLNKGWNSRYIALGPSYKLINDKFELILDAKVGISQIQLNSLVYSKSFAQQPYEMYRLNGFTKNYAPMWMPGIAIKFPLFKNIAIQGKAQYFSTQFMDKLETITTYRNVVDIDRNGIMDDDEFFNSQKLTKVSSTDVSSMMVSMGVIFNLFQNHKEPSESDNMTSDMRKQFEQLPDVQIIQADTSVVIDEPTLNTDSAAFKTNNNTNVRQNSTDSTLMNKPTLDNRKVDQNDANLVKSTDAKTETVPTLQKIDSTNTKAKPIDNQNTKVKYETPIQSKKEEVKKVEQTKVAVESEVKNMEPKPTNEGQNVVNDSLSTRSKDLDLRKTESASKPSLKEKQNDVKNDTNLSKQNTIQRPNDESSVVTKDPSLETDFSGVLEYKIQFTAINKPNASFPRVAKIKPVEIEYFEDAKLYRYSINEYKTIDAALLDLAHVRKLGYKQAFIAEYKDGVRIKTIYHN